MRCNLSICGGFMKLHQALSSIVLSVTLVGCGSNKDFTGKSINSLLKDPESGQCTRVNAVGKFRAQELMSPFETSGQKVHLQENMFGEMGPQSFAFQNKTVAPKKLSVIVDESCILNARENNLNSELTASLEIKESIARSHFPTRTHIVSLDKEISLSELQRLAEEDSCVEGVSEYVEMNITAQPNDPSYSQERHMPNIKAAEAYDIFFHQSTGIKQDIIIAIIDSGVDLDHPDLRDNLWTNPGEIPGNGVDDDNNGYVDDVYGYNFASDIADPRPQPWTQQAGSETHGTHVAGLAAARSNNGVGVAGVHGERIKIMSLNVFGRVPGASNANIEAAIRYAADNGAHVMNLSLGGSGRTDSTGTALRYAVQKGTMVIAAAGNSNQDIQSNFFTPASFGPSIEGMLAIGATDAGSNAKCGFSNYSTSFVEMAAPGCGGLYSTLMNNRYGNLQGTSMASPVTAGAATLAYALYRARKGSFPTPAEIEDVMIRGSRVQSGLTGVFKAGRVVDLMALGTLMDSEFPSGGGGPGDPGDPGDGGGDCD